MVQRAPPQTTRPQQTTTRSRSQTRTLTPFMLIPSSNPTVCDIVYVMEVLICLCVIYFSLKIIDILKIIYYFFFFSKITITSSFTTILKMTGSSMDVHINVGGGVHERSNNNFSESTNRITQARKMLTKAKETIAKMDQVVCLFL